MRNLLWCLSCLDRVWLYARAMKRGFRSGAEVIAGSSIHGGMTSFVSINGIDWPEFATTAHSFWRAQELTLFRQHAHLFSAPAADLGCGDGAFAVMAGFPAKTIGLDYDPASLR